MRLGVSPTTASTPTGVFYQCCEALFPHAGALGCAVCCLASQLQPCPPCSTIHHLAGFSSHHPAMSPLCLAARLCPSYSMDECFFFISLVVGLPCSSVSSGCFLCLDCCSPPFGCARRHSVSTYASILAGSPGFQYMKLGVGVPTFRP